MKPIVLVGMMGAGKSTIGKKLAEKLDLNFFDTDRIIEKEAGMKIKNIFEKKGEKFFRDAEITTISSLLKNDDLVIASGGGLFIQEGARKIIKEKSISIYLDVSFEELYRRVSSCRKRVLLQVENKKDFLLNLYKAREGIYNLADIIVKNENASYNNVIDNIIIQLKCLNWM